MVLSEEILLAFSRSPHTTDYHMSDDDVAVENALDLLYDQFGPEVLQHIQGKHILDYGCGYGKQAVAYLLNGASHVTGVDIVKENIDHARSLAEKHGVAPQLSLLLGDAHGVRLPHQHFDTIITVNSFEHFPDPEGVLKVCYPALKPQGRFLITFGPPWLHPYGSHMHFFTRLPWPHLLFSERTVMKVRRRFRQDYAEHYTDVEGGLNQITIRRFINIAKGSGFHVEGLKLCGIKRMKFLTRVAFLREFFTNRVNCILSKK